MDDLDAAISEICISCGMCCDGTLFETATIKNLKDAKLAKSIGLTIVQKNKKQHFKLPCHHFNRCCTVYDQPRPHTCSNFFCKPIKKLKNGESTVPEVRDHINEAMRYKRHFELQLRQYPEFESQSIHEIEAILCNSNMTTEQKKEHHRKYAGLYLVGIKLFPLLRLMKSDDDPSEDKTSKSKTTLL